MLFAIQQLAPSLTPFGVLFLLVPVALFYLQRLIKLQVIMLESLHAIPVYPMPF